MAQQLTEEQKREQALERTFKNIPSLRYFWELLNEVADNQLELWGKLESMETRQEVLITIAQHLPTGNGHSPEPSEDDLKAQIKQAVDSGDFEQATKLGEQLKALKGPKAPEAKPKMNEEERKAWGKDMAERRAAKAAEKAAGNGSATKAE